MLWGARPDRLHQKITLFIGRTFLANVCDMLQSASDQKLDAGMSVKSIPGNLTSTILHLFILPISVFIRLLRFPGISDKIDLPQFATAIAVSFVRLPAPLQA